MAVSPTACLHCSACGCSVTAQEFSAPPCSAPPDSSVTSLSPVRCCGLSPGLDRLHVCLASDQRTIRARHPSCSSSPAPDKAFLKPCMQWNGHGEQQLLPCWVSPCSDLVHMDGVACDGSQCSRIPENLPAPFKNASCIEANSLSWRQTGRLGTKASHKWVHVSPSMWMHFSGMGTGSR